MRRCPSVIALSVLSLAIVGCSSGGTGVLLPSDYARGEGMAAQDSRYKVYATPGSTGTIEQPGVLVGGMTPLAASTDIGIDRDVSRFPNLPGSMQADNSRQFR